MAQQCEERGDCKGFVAFVDDGKVYGVPVEPEGEERGCCVNGNHEENSYNTEEGRLADVGEVEGEGWNRTVVARKVSCNSSRASISGKKRAGRR